MSEPMDERDDRPWYRQFWPWFIISLPAASVIAGIATVIIAHSQPMAMVVDDYSRIGKFTQQNAERRRTAAQRGLSAELRRRDDGGLRLSLGEALGRPAAETLRLRFVHPTLGRRDFTAGLEPAAGGYRVEVSEALTGRWYIQLEDTAGQWRLDGELRAGSRRIELAPHRARRADWR